MNKELCMVEVSFVNGNRIQKFAFDNLSLLLGRSCLKEVLLLFARCKDYVKAWKRLTVKRAPNILTIALKRFQV